MCSLSRWDFAKAKQAFVCLTWRSGASFGEAVPHLICCHQHGSDSSGWPRWWSSDSFSPLAPSALPLQVLLLTSCHVERLVYFNNTLYCGHWKWKTFRWWPCRSFLKCEQPQCKAPGPHWALFVLATHQQQRAALLHLMSWLKQLFPIRAAWTIWSGIEPWIFP